MYKLLIALFVLGCGPASVGTLHGDASVGISCRSGEVLCPTRQDAAPFFVCANLQSDPKNCGACANVCRFPMQCYMGVCGAIPLD